VTVAQLDTDVTPYDVNTNASSSTVVMGLSVQRAAQDLNINYYAMRRRSSKPNPNGAARGRQNRRRQGSDTFFYRTDAQVFLSRSGEIIGHGAYQSIKSGRLRLVRPRILEISWGGAEVEVDRETGEISCSSMFPWLMLAERFTRCSARARMGAA